jgi:hypothetical protein
VRFFRSASPLAVVIAVSSAAVLAAVAGCGGSTSGSSADPLAGMTAGQIYAQALDNLKAASSVHLTGSIVTFGGALTMNLTDGPGGCTGTLSTQGSGSVGLVGIGSKLWLKPDRQYLKSSGASAALTNLLTGKYVSTTDKSANLATLCGLSRITSQLSTGSTFTKGTATTISGQRVLQIKATGQSGSEYVTNSASPQVVRLDTGSGIMDFSDYNAPLTLTPPPASQTVDGSKYGF